MFPAPLIAVEGLESAGKSSLCTRIHEHLSETDNELTNLLYTPKLISFPMRYTATGEIFDKYLCKEPYKAAKGKFSIEFFKQFYVGLPRPDLTIFLKKESEVVLNVKYL